jgi:hypothetical protein
MGDSTMISHEAHDRCVLIGAALGLGLTAFYAPLLLVVLGIYVFVGVFN